MDEPERKKGRGSFRVSRQAIKMLLDTKASALQICSYLTLAKHTDHGGRFSTAGIKAIHTATGVSHPVIKKAVDAMIKAKLIYTANDWKEATGEIIPDAPFDRAAVRYVLDDFKSEPADWVWFGNELVSGVGKFTQPLKRLKMCGDIAARVLLIGYQHHDLEQYGGINPEAFYHGYDMTKVLTLDGHDIWHGELITTTAFHSAIFPALGISSEPKYDEWDKPFWDAIKSLDAAGFMYQMVTAMDRPAGDDEAQVIYELDAKSKHGYKPKGEEGLGGMTARISGMLGYPVADSNGRFYGKYAAIVPVGIQTYIIGIYRLRFRVANTKNHGVAGAWARIYQGQREAADWLNELAEQYGIELKGEAA